MTSYKDFFNCKYPIICVPMNQVSNLSLAVAIHNAGAFPSLSSFNYYSSNGFDKEYFEKDLLNFQEQTGSSNILISIDWNEIIKDEIKDFLIKNNFKFIELFNRSIDSISWNTLENTIEELKNNNINIIFKTLGTKPKYHNGVVILKGSEGAGRAIDNNKSLEEKFNHLKYEDTDLKIIPSGGISTSEQIKYFMELGAFAIGIGTLFAMSEESCVSNETKEKVIQSSSNNLSRIGKFKSQGILFKETINDDDNNTKSLIQGMKSPKQGLIYVGKGIDNIYKIRPVKDIIEDLIKDGY